MFYVIQKNTFKEPHFNLLIENMNRFKFEFEIVDYRPFAHTIKFKTKRKDVFCFGATSMVNAAVKYGWKPGSMMNANHDFEVYGKHYGNNMLNADGSVIGFYEPLPKTLPYAFFARPTKDSKIFTGGLYTHDSWNNYVNEVKEGKAKLISTDGEISEMEGWIGEDTKILVAPLKNIQQEVRCWVVDGKVVTASRYKIGERVVYKNYDDETFYIDFANEMVKKYQPSEAFVIDVCLADDELKIVELNCINASGFYHANMVKLIEGLESHFN